MSESSASAIYEGTIRHRRLAVRAHEFTHRLALAYIDLDELETLIGGRLLARRPGLVRFRRADYLGEEEVDLASAVRSRVERETGCAPSGPIRVLTHLRTFGHCYNPVSFYYCFDPHGRLDALVAEVTSTPWGERQAYVLGRGRSGDGPVLAGELAKRMHVSPFMGMQQRYLLRADTPAETLSVHVASSERGQRVFDATLALRRRPLTRRSLAGVVARYPAPTLRALALIYGHAAVLRLRGVPLHQRPRVQP